jgi:undecaprenyl-diphosphatase
MNALQALLISFVEGITEYLPVSSTGHQVLASHILGVQQTEFLKSFEIIIQLGAIAAIVFLYWKIFLQDREVWKRIIVAFIPTAIIGFILYKIIKMFLLGNEWVTVLALFIGGIILILIEKTHKEKDTHIEHIKDMSLKNAFFIGLIQSISVIPGVSRAGATIIGGMLLGTKRKTAVEFSFLLAVPTMLAATGLDLLKSSHSFSTNEYLLLTVGLIGSFITAIVTVKYLLKFVQSHTFVSFGIYRMIIAVIYAIIFLR